MPNTYHTGRERNDSARPELKFWVAKNDRAVAVREPAARTFEGTEIEVDGFPTYEAKADAERWVRENYGQYCTVESDASLSNGFEIVTAPMTLAAHRAVDWGTLLIKMDEFGGHAHDSCNCGLHIHVSRAALGNEDRTKMLCIGKILFMMEKHQQQFSCIGRRDIASTGFAGPVRYGHAITDGSRAIIRKAQAVQNRQGLGVHTSARYAALNLQNRSTIEFRFPKGTLKPETFYATLAFIEGIVRFAKQHTSPEIKDFTFDQIIQWIDDENLTNYWNTRRQYTSRFTPYRS